MSWDGSGNFTRSNGTYSGPTVWQQDESAAVDIEADRHDTHDQDLADGIEACLAKNGENSMTGDLDLGGNDIVDVSSLTLTGSDAVDLTDGTNVLNIGNTSTTHLAADGQDLQAKNGTTTASSLNLNPLGGDVNIGAQSGTGSTVFYDDGGIVGYTDGSGLNVQHTTADDPYVQLRDSSGTALAHFRHIGGTSTEIRSYSDGLPIRLYGDDAGDTEQLMLNADPDTGVTLYYQGTARIESTSSGGKATGQEWEIDNSGASTVAFMNFYNSEGGGQVASDGGDVFLRFTDNTGAFTANFLTATNGAELGFLYNGTEEAQTQDSDANYNTSGLLTKDHGGTLREVGFNVMVADEEDASLTLSEVHAGRMLHKDSTSNVTITLPSGTSGAVPPVGSTIMYTRENGTGTVTFSAAGTLRWFDGTGTPSTGNRSLANGGLVTLYHYSNTEWWIWGAGIS